MSDQQNSLTDLPKLDQSKQVAVREVIFQYVKYLPWVLISVGLGFVLARVKIRYSVPIYHVQSSLLINKDQTSGIGGKEGQRMDELFMFQPVNNLNNEIEILRSHPLMARVAKDLNLQTQYYNKGNIRSTLLYENLPFVLRIVDMADSTDGFGFSILIKNENQFTLNEETLVRNFGEPFMLGRDKIVLERTPGTLLKNYSVQAFSISWTPLIYASDGLCNTVKVAQINTQSTVLTLSEETPVPRIGLDVLNTVMEVYDSMIVEDKNKIALQTLHFIDDRLNSLRSELGTTEGALRSFMETNQAFDIGSQSKIDLDNYSRGVDEKNVQEVKINLIDYLIEYLGNAQNNYKTVPVNLGITEPSLEQLIQMYNRAELDREANLKTTTANNAIIVNLEASLEKLRSNILEALQNIKRGYQIAQGRIVQRERDLRNNLTSLPGKSMQALGIERQQKILEELYSFLLQKKLETTISSASTISNSKVIEPARDDPFPISPNPKSLYMTYCLIGLIVPVIIIALLELLNDKVTERADITKATNTPIVGEVGHSENTKTLVVTTTSRSFISEQFRIVRANLQYMVGKKENPTILVTSSFSGEGKSFVSTNLGAVMALTGKRTVIMEFDIRKPKILSGLELKRKMGITNYIIGKATFDELPVAVDGVDNLYVIPCGPIPPNPAELLLDPRLAQLMEEVKRNFDVVIMDTAPVGLVSDAISLASFADSTVYIVRNGYTLRRLLGFVEELYKYKKVPSLSILLNDVKTTGVYGRYYGSYGYNASYGYGNSSGYFDEGMSSGGLLRRLSNFWKRWFS